MDKSIICTTMVKWTLEQFLEQLQMHSYLLIVVRGFRQLEKHDAVQKLKRDQQGKQYCPWNERFYGAVTAFSSLVGFQDE